MLKKPDWLRIKLPTAREYSQVKFYLGKHKLHTICESGSCPNLGECWAAGNATFMILGDICTRSCGFCNVKTGKPNNVDSGEPMRVAEAIKLMNLKHCVITSVDRDDLEDGGSGIWAETVKAIRKLNPDTTIETLIPDFQGNYKNLQKVLSTKPDIVSHNLETVKSLTKKVRKQAIYERSLDVIKNISDAGIKSKSGIMVGLGETKEEIMETMDDLIKVRCKIFTVGQYLQPTKNHLPVMEYIHPDVFEEIKKAGYEKGFEFVESGPLVRSSYHAEKQV
ncbi:MAG: lipoyl synthase [Bacteroidales bacterium]|nr:lipoyl synthase [Bacteroidales bacterium]